MILFVEFRIKVVQTIDALKFETSRRSCRGEEAFLTENIGSGRVLTIASQCKLWYGPDLRRWTQTDDEQQLYCSETDFYRIDRSRKIVKRSRIDYDCMNYLTSSRMENKCHMVYVSDLRQKCKKCYDVMTLSSFADLLDTNDTCIVTYFQQ